MTFLAVDVLHHLALAAAMLLLLELLVFVILFLAIAGGLAFGFHWVRGKVNWGAEKAGAALQTAAHYIDTGTGYAAKPFIVATGAGDRVKATALAIKRMVWTNRAGSLGLRTRPAAVPVPRAEAGPPGGGVTESIPAIAAPPQDLGVTPTVVSTSQGQPAAVAVPRPDENMPIV